jgi:hypothetical protein
MRPDHQLSKVAASCEIEPPVTVTIDVALIRCEPIAKGRPWTFILDIANRLNNKRSCVDGRRAGNITKPVTNVLSAILLEKDAAR